MTFAERFKQLRKESGLSQGDISKLVGWASPQLVSNCERKLSYIPPIALVKICKKYGWNLQELMGLIIDEKVVKVRAKYGQ
jgi:transcriptional regulator with XRE-family HTH domain